MSFYKKLFFLCLLFLFSLFSFAKFPKKNFSKTSFAFDFPYFFYFPEKELLVFEDSVFPCSQALTQKKEENFSFFKIHKVKEGDTLEKISQIYGISKEALILNNNLEKEKVSLGQELLIPFCDGLIYFPQKEDLEEISKKFNVLPQKILKDNKLKSEKEIKEREFLMLCDIDLKKLMPKEKQSQKSNKNQKRNQKLVFEPKTFTFSDSNPYPYGYCTFYAFQKRKDLPKNLGNAKDWLKNAKLQGLQVCEGKDCPPKERAVVSLSSPHSLGHVGVVEKVEGNKILVCEMNQEGWAKVSCRELQVGDPRIKGYIY